MGGSTHVDTTPVTQHAVERPGTGGRCHGDAPTGGTGAGAPHRLVVDAGMSAGGALNVLVLGGTGEARLLAARLVERGDRVLTSLAGRVTAPAMPVGDVRSGGFGGVDGLAAHLERHRHDVVVDATHPFAATISGHAAAACALVGVPLVRLQRPGWSHHPLADRFTWADDIHAACALAGSLGVRPFLTTGRQQLEVFARWDDRYVLARVVDPPDWEVPACWEVLRDRGPYAYDAEHGLMTSRRIDVLLTKDSGGALTEAKLRAAHDLRLPIVVVRRPPVVEGVRVVESVDDAVLALQTVSAPGARRQAPLGGQRTPPRRPHR